MPDFENDPDALLASNYSTVFLLFQSSCVARSVLRENLPMCLLRGVASARRETIGDVIPWHYEILITPTWLKSLHLDAPPTAGVRLDAACICLELLLWPRVPEGRR